MTLHPRRIVRLAARGTAPIVVAVAVQSVGNLAFHAVVGRLLDPGSYGALGAVLGAMVMLGVPLGALQAAASALSAGHGASPADTRSTLLSVAMWSLPPALLVLAAAPLCRDYFHLASVLQAAQLAPYLLAASVVATARGLLLGDRRVGAVAATYVAGTVVRLALGFALVLPFGVSGALAATVAAEFAALLVAVWRLRGPATARRTPSGGSPSGSPGDGPAPRRPPRRGPRLRLGSVARAGIAVTGLFLFSTADLLLARHHLGDGASGRYVAAATVAKTVLALPAGIMAAVFPRLLTAWPTGERARTLFLGGAAVVGPALLGAAVLGAAPSLVVRMLYGDAYADAAGLVRTLSIVAGLTAVVTVATHAALARNGRTVVLPWAGAVLEVALIEVWHDSAAQIAACSAVALVPTLLVMVVLEGRRWSGAIRRNPQVAAAGADRGPTAATAA